MALPGYPFGAYKNWSLGWSIDHDQWHCHGILRKHHCAMSLPSCLRWQQGPSFYLHIQFRVQVGSETRHSFGRSGWLAISGHFSCPDQVRTFFVRTTRTWRNLCHGSKKPNVFLFLHFSQGVNVALTCHDFLESHSYSWDDRGVLNNPILCGVGKCPSHGGFLAGENHPKTGLDVLGFFQPRRWHRKVDG